MPGPPEGQAKSAPPRPAAAVSPAGPPVTGPVRGLLIGGADSGGESRGTVALTTETGITRRIFWILSGSGAAAVAAIVLLAVLMAGETDRIARDGSTRLVASAFAAEVRRVSLSTRDYGNWDEGFEWVLARDDQAVLANLGTGATEGPAFDFLYIVDARGAPLYAFESDGTSSDLSLYDPAPAAESLAAIAALPVEPYESVAGFARFGDRVAVLGAGRVQPFHAAGLATADLPVLLAGIWLDEARVAALGEGLLLPGLVLVSDTAPLVDGHVAWALRDLDDHVVAFAAWPAPRPGLQVLEGALPILAATSFLLFAGVFVVGRASARQSAGIVRERLRARTDGLTGLMNRAGLNELVDTPDVRAAIRRGEAAVAYLDLNGFKALNDEVGHDGGDRALIVTADRLRRSMRHADTIARLGGDEFVALILDAEPDEAVRAVCERIVTQTEQPLRIGGGEFYARPSIGVAIAAPGSQWDELLLRADSAMYRAKRDALFRPVIDRPPGRPRPHTSRVASLG